MARSIYLINPRSDTPSYAGGEAFARWGLTPGTVYADLAVPTVAALVPDGWDVSLCDENCGPVDLETPAAFVGLTGKVNQFGRACELATEFRRRGKVVLMGGSFATLSPDRVRPHCDVLVRGELEGIAEELFADLARGGWREEYEGGRPELDRTVVPRWDLYPNVRASLGAVQTSRGCPFECEFCDVIVYLGRKQRHKPVASVLAELDETYRHGYRRVFLSDDNLTVYRQRAKELLRGLRDWNRAQTAGKVEFYTQASIDGARDPELLALCAEAGLVHVFLGIETPNEESLLETKKRQNLVDQVRATEAYLRAGIGLSCGAIVGFDHDGLDIFERQLAFLQSLAIPVITFGSLTAPEGTPLHARLAAEGRLIESGSETIAMPWNSNVIPARMSHAELEEGSRWLANALYHPPNYEHRILRMIELLGERRDPRGLEPPAESEPVRAIDEDSVELIRALPRMGPLETRMLTRVTAAARARPGARSFAAEALSYYVHVRHTYEESGLWEPDPERRARPYAEVACASR